MSACPARVNAMHALSLCRQRPSKAAVRRLQKKLRAEPRKQSIRHGANLATLISMAVLAARTVAHENNARAVGQSKALLVEPISRRQRPVCTCRTLHRRTRAHERRAVPRVEHHRGIVRCGLLMSGGCWLGQIVWVRERLHSLSFAIVVLSLLPVGIHFVAERAKTRNKELADASAAGRR